MNNSENKQQWIGEAITRWVMQGVRLESGASPEKIDSFEKLLGFNFPQEFRELYGKMNGFQDFVMNDDMFCLWSLERITKEEMIVIMSGFAII